MSDTLKITVEIDDVGSIKKTEQALDRVRVSAEGIGVRGAGGIDDMTRAMARSVLQGNAMFAGIERGIMSMNRAVLEMARYAAVSQTYQTAMYAMARANGVTSDTADRLEGRLKSLGITAQAARLSISQSIGAGFDLGKVPGIARLGQNLAVMKPDMTSSQVFQDLVRGIQSGETEVLRTLGLNVNFEGAYRDFAREAKKGVDALTEYEKMQIRVNEVMRQAPKYAGMYEDAMGSVGKQMQSMRRFAEDAKDAIGKNFIPAMELVVNTAMWALKKVKESPEIARGAALAGGTATGAAIGGGVGAFFGGLGAVPGAAIGGTLGFLGTSASLIYSGQKNLGQAADDAIWGAARRKAEGQEAEQRAAQIKADRDLDAARISRQDLEKKQAGAEKDAARILREASIGSAAGLRRVAIELQSNLHLYGLTKKAIDDIRKAAEQKATHEIQALQDQQRKDRIEKGTERLKEGLDHAAKVAELMIEQDQRARGATSKYMGEVGDLYGEKTKMGFDRQPVELQAVHEAQLRQLEMVDTRTLRQKISLEQQKLAIEVDYLKQSEVLQAAKISRETEESIRQARIRAYEIGRTDEEVQALAASKTEAIRAIQAEREKAMTADTQTAISAARDNAAIRSAGIVRDAYTSQFTHLKDSAGRVFDALVSKTSSFGDQIKNILRTALLTPIKEFVSSWVAAMLMGGKMQGGGSMAMGGGILGGLFGMGGGFVPQFGPGGTAPFNPNAPAGSWQLMPGMVGLASNGQQMAVPGTGGITSQAGMLANLKGMWANSKGMLSSLGNIGYGPKGGDFGGEVAGSYSGVGGWQGGALLAGGSMLAMDGLRRGGWAGVGETTAGGAAIGYKFGRWEGAAIGGAIGFGAGMLRMLFGGKSPDQKMRERIKSITGVDVREKDILLQCVQMAKQQFGGNYDLFVRSRTGQDLIEMYAESTGQKFRSQFNVPQVQFGLSGGSMYEIPSYYNGSTGNPLSSLPGLGFSSSLDSLRGGVASNGPMSITLKLDGPATTAIMRGEAVQVVVNNPRTVAASVSRAQSQNFNRSASAALLLSPSALRA